MTASALLCPMAYSNCLLWIDGDIHLRLAVTHLANPQHGRMIDFPLADDVRPRMAVSFNTCRIAVTASPANSVLIAHPVCGGQPVLPAP